MLELIEHDITDLEQADADCLTRIQRIQHERAEARIRLDYALKLRERIIMRELQDANPLSTPIAEAVQRVLDGDPKLAADVQAIIDGPPPTNPDSDLERARQFNREKRNQRDRNKRAGRAKPAQDTPSPLT